MDADSCALVWLAGLCGFFLFNLCDLLLKPKIPFKKSLWAWIAQFGLFSIPYSFFTILLGRVWCAVAATLASYIILIFVNNAKYASLREPFLFQDYDYFLDTLRFPRLFLPFLGLKSFSLCAAGCLLAIAGLLLESPPENRWSKQLPAAILFLASGCAALIASRQHMPLPGSSPLNDYKAIGFAPFLWIYGLESRRPPQAVSPFASIKSISCNDLPHLIAVQSESFFDPRPMFSGIKPDILNNLDLFRQESHAHGSLNVPAWGANTVRTEFSFLTGISPADMGIHRFSPYQIMARGWHPSTLPAALQKMGYHTVCIHPYHGAFYGRKKIFSHVGFAEFIDINEFKNELRAGAYTGDVPLGKKIIDMVGKSGKPIFIFAITMENHGPLQMEVAGGCDEEAQYFDFAPPPGCQELAIYLRHLIHANQMLGMFHSAWAKHNENISLCFYGDHVPIMPACYRTFGYPSGKVPWFYWENRIKEKRPPEDLQVCDLALSWLQSMKLF